MDSGKAFFLGPSFSLFWQPDLPIFGGVWSLFRIWGSIFIAHCTRTSNLEFQIWGSALIEPKCSGHYFPGFEVPARWNLKSGKVARWSQRVQLNCIFEGLKIAKKCGFQFHPISSTTRFWFQAFWHLMRREGLLTRCQGHCVFSWNAKLGFLIVELQYVVFHFHFLEFFFVSFYVKLVSAW